MAPSSREGVIKFQLDFDLGPAPEAQLLVELNQWREVFLQHGLLGQDPQRYQGYGFGNLSRRLPDDQGDAFVISGTQTGHLALLQPHDYATVVACDPLSNYIKASGPVRPSSEALSHGILYQSAPEIFWVMHLHSPDIFSRRDFLHVPCTDPEAPYGTPEMALEIQRLALEADHTKPNLLVMTGHQDGIVAYGPTADETAKLVLEILHLARQTP